MKALDSRRILVTANANNGCSPCTPLNSSSSPGQLGQKGMVLSPGDPIFQTRPGWIRPWAA